MNFFKPAIKLMRPTQWIKNGFVFMPLIFSSRLFHIEDVAKVVGMCLVFCPCFFGNVHLQRLPRPGTGPSPTPSRGIARWRGGTSLPLPALIFMGFLTAAFLALAVLLKIPFVGFAIVIGYVLLSCRILVLAQRHRHRRRSLP